MRPRVSVRALFARVRRCLGDVRRARRCVPGFASGQIGALVRRPSGAGQTLWCAFRFLPGAGAALAVWLGALAKFLLVVRSWGLRIARLVAAWRVSARFVWGVRAWGVRTWSAAAFVTRTVAIFRAWGARSVLTGFAVVLATRWARPILTRFATILLSRFATGFLALFVGEGGDTFTGGLVLGTPFAGWDLLTRQSFDVAQQAAFFTIAERDCNAFGAGARGAADAMDVSLGHVRQVEVDDVANAVDVDTAGGDVGGDQDAGAARAEGVQGVDALALAFVAVDGRADNSCTIEGANDLVGSVLGAGEDQDAVHVLVVAQQFDQQGTLGAVVDVDDALGNFFHGGGLRGDADADRVLQQIAGKGANFLRHGGREEQVLTLARQIRDQLADVVDEAHVEHAVGFVEDEDFRLGEVDGALIDEIEQAARRCDQNVDAGPHDLLLLIFADAAEDGGDIHIHKAPVGLEIVGDLGRKLTRRGQDKGARGLGRGRALVSGKPLEDGKGEACGLAGAGLGNAEQVLSRQYMGDGLGLDWGWGLVAFLRQSFQEARFEAERIKIVQFQYFQ